MKMGPHICDWEIVILCNCLLSGSSKFQTEIQYHGLIDTVCLSSLTCQSSPRPRPRDEETTDISGYLFVLEYDKNRPSIGFLLDP